MPLIPLSDTTQQDWDKVDAALVPLDDDGLSGAVLFRILDNVVSQIGRTECLTMLEAVVDRVCEMQMERGDPPFRS